MNNEIEVLKEQLSQANKRIAAAEQSQGSGQPAKEASTCPSAANPIQTASDSKQERTATLTPQNVQDLCDSVRRNHQDSDDEEFVTAPSTAKSSERDVTEANSVARLSQADTTPELNSDGYRRNNRMSIPKWPTYNALHS